MIVFDFLISIFWATFAAYDISHGKWVFGAIELVFAMYQMNQFTDGLKTKVGRG